MLIADGNEWHKLSATHATGDSNIATEAEETKLIAYSGSKDLKLAASHLTLAIHSRVKCNVNVGTQIGLYNGAMGSVHSFGYLDNGEVGIVFVKMDDDIGYTCDTSDDPVSNLVSFY